MMCVVMQWGRKSTFNKTEVFDGGRGGGGEGASSETKLLSRIPPLTLELYLSFSWLFHVFAGHSKYML